MGLIGQDKLLSIGHVSGIPAHEWQQVTFRIFITFQNANGPVFLRQQQ